MATTVVAGVFVLLGAVLGFLITERSNRQNAVRDDERANALLRRNEFRTAVVEFASAAVIFQKVEMDRWHAERGTWWVRRNAADTIDRARIARSAAVHAQNVLALSAMDKAPIDEAYKIVEQADEIRRATGVDALTKRAEKVRKRVADLVDKACRQLVEPD